ncbi:MAG: Fe-S cluster domain-containing protein [Bacteroidales bacterium]|nr:Fe-S cluster domain-containing protein [Bacteroidales bacterium]
MNAIVIALIVLGSIGLLLALVLFLAAKAFYVEEDPRIDQVQEVLPGANCGGCGYPGCRGFAEACVKSSSLDSMLCPVGGAETMSKIGEILGMASVAAAPKVAVLRCNGSCANRPKVNHYDSASSCAVAAALYGGETACSYGCLGMGDCVDVCQFGALAINPETGLPEINEEKCTACGACVKACPKMLLELRNKGPKSRRIYVACRNHDKGAVAKKACAAACIGCSKCQKVCEFEAITMDNNVAYIDYNKCRLCRKCEEACPTGAIHALNFPPRKPKAEKPAAEATAKPVAPKVVKAEAAPAEAPKAPEAPKAAETETPKAE